MNRFAWRRRETRHFGDQWTPFAQLLLLAADGRWRRISVQIDTGAVITVLKPSVAAALGISLRSTDPIELVSVGGKASRYFVHCCTARVGTLAERNVRIAFAESEDVPNLLGRVDVLEGLIMTLDGGCGITTISVASPTNP